MSYLGLEKLNLHYKEKKIFLPLPVLEIFKRLYQGNKSVFFLESLGEDAIFSRYSYIGFSPYLSIKARGNKLDINGKIHDVNNPYQILKEINQIKIKCEHFCGGLVGYVSYEAAKYFENALTMKVNKDFYDFEFGLYLDGLIFNRKTSELKYFYLKEDRSEKIVKFLKRNVKLDTFEVNYSGTNINKQEFIKMVRTAKEEILKGSSFQIVLSRRYDFKINSGSPLFFYERLRELNPSPHMFYLKFGEREIISSSPELIMRLENGCIQNFPLAGTRKRGWTKEEDEAIAQELLNNDKERAEHMMLVDLGRNDVGRISDFGSVKVSKLMQIKKFSHVQHIGSEITGKISKKWNMFDALAVNSPMGTVSGAPKIETMKIIESLEKTARGPYAGSGGFFSFNHDCIFAIAIRSLFICRKKAYIQTGAGIVHDSIPENEFLETERKAASLMYSLGIPLTKRY